MTQPDAGVSTRTPRRPGGGFAPPARGRGTRCGSAPGVSRGRGGAGLPGGPGAGRGGGAGDVKRLGQVRSGRCCSGRVGRLAEAGRGA